MNLERLILSLKESEGYRRLPYQDSLGFWTVGWGHYIHKDILQHTGTLTFSELMSYYSDPKKHQTWLESDVQSAIAGAKKWVGDPLWNAITDLRREVVVEMRFQLGGKQEKFVSMKAMLDDHNYEAVAKSMLDSLWATQTPQRVHRMAQHMKTG